MLATLLKSLTKLNKQSKEIVQKKIMNLKKL